MRRLLLFTLLVGISTWASCGWAGEKSVEPEGMGFMVCDKQLVCHADKILMENHATCYQHMREAMTSIDPYVQGREEFYPHVRGWRMGSVTKDQWDQTMKDCVEGR